jgi:hypothetical protein
MNAGRDPVWHAGRLVQWGLRPLARPAQEPEYRELVERYFDDTAFRTIVRDVAGRRIAEEVLGPEELRKAWATYPEPSAL